LVVDNLSCFVFAKQFLLFTNAQSVPEIDRSMIAHSAPIINQIKYLVIIVLYTVHLASSPRLNKYIF
jgi:hypothetical protein